MLFAKSYRNFHKQLRNFDTNIDSSTNQLFDDFLNVHGGQLISSPDEFFEITASAREEVNTTIQNLIAENRSLLQSRNDLFTELVETSPFSDGIVILQEQLEFNSERMNINYNEILALNNDLTTLSNINDAAGFVFSIMQELEFFGLTALPIAFLIYFIKLVLKEGKTSHVKEALKFFFTEIYNQYSTVAKARLRVKETLTEQWSYYSDKKNWTVLLFFTAWYSALKGFWVYFLKYLRKSRIWNNLRSLLNSIAREAVTNLNNFIDNKDEVNFIYINDAQIANLTTLSDHNAFLFENLHVDGQLSIEEVNETIRDLSLRNYVYSQVTTFNAYPTEYIIRLPSTYYQTNCLAPYGGIFWVRVFKKLPKKP